MELVIRCPKCGEDTEHELLKERNEVVTAKCLDCGHVHSFSPPRARIIEVGVVISEGATSRSDRMEVLLDEPVVVGHEFDHGGHRHLVTSIEGHDGRTHQQLVGRDVKTVFAKLFDTVTLKLSVNEGDITQSYKMEVEPERAIHIGEVIAVEGRKLKVKTLKSDENRTLHRGFLMARNVRRCFCDEVPHWVKEGKILEPRKRGKPKGAKSAPRHGRKA